MIARAKSSMEVDCIAAQSNKNNKCFGNARFLEQVETSEAEETAALAECKALDLPFTRWFGGSELGCPWAQRRGIWEERTAGAAAAGPLQGRVSEGHPVEQD